MGMYIISSGESATLADYLPCIPHDLSWSNVRCSMTVLTVWWCLFSIIKAMLCIGSGWSAVGWTGTLHLVTHTHTHTHAQTRTDTLKVYQSCSYYSYKPLVHSCKETHHWRELSNRWCLWRHRHGYNLGSCGFIPSAGLWLTFVESPAYEQRCKYHQISRSPRAPDREAAVAGPCVAGCTSMRKRNQMKDRNEWRNESINQSMNQ